MSSLPTFFADEEKFSFLSAGLKHILPKFRDGWQTTKKEGRDINTKAGGLWASELKCYFHMALLVNHDYVCGSCMTEQKFNVINLIAFPPIFTEI